MTLSPIDRQALDRADAGPVLVLGATGTTGSRLVSALQSADVPVRAASRHPVASPDPGVTTVAFSWSDDRTWAAALRGARAVYVLPPPGSAAPEEPTLDLVRRARELGVDRVVVLSASAITAEDPGLGRVHAALAAGPSGWTVLRPTWFSQNLLDPSHHLGAAVARGDELVTATGAARIAFVDAGDIAAVAARALLDPRPHDADHVITGPEALSYDDVAAVLSAATGREVRHRDATAEVVARSMVDAGIPPGYAELLAGLETAVAGGSEDRVTTTVLDVTGRPPRRFADVVADAMDGVAIR